ncbi:hypothetical protein PhCBS80983_g00423 [Powellomyces hirtus]|uniref:Uncharacterized protein n=1 Tax=Powellomyces hirtus TaxID=109895 RepID=A0A507EFN6_9FUNG|nr:hypothetical protein PhCBS80983_g00423 [Powellomyces hirtus]
MESWTAARNRERDIQHGVLTTDKDAKRTVEFCLCHQLRNDFTVIAIVLRRYGANSVEDLDPSVLGHAGLVYEHVLGEEKFTFVEDVKNPQSVTILITVSNAIEDQYLVPGAAAFQVALRAHLMKFKDSVKGRPKMGVQAFADAMLIIPKLLSQNGGFDVQDVLGALQEEHAAGHNVGNDLVTGETLDPVAAVLRPNITVNLATTSSVIASNFLLVDEMMRARRSSLRQSNAE